MLNNLKNIWKRFLNDDEDAFEDLYHEYANQLYSYGMKIVQDEDLVKDCIQEAFIHLIDNKKRIILTPRIHLYLFKSLRNKLYEELRTGKMKAAHNKEAYAESPAFEMSLETTIIESEKFQEKKKILNKALEQLTEKQREVLFLRYTEGMEYSEIANILDIDIASVRTLVYRSLKALKCIIE